MQLIYLFTILVTFIGTSKCTNIEGENVITWCTTSLLEHSKCEKLANTTVLDKGLFQKDYIELLCKRAFDAEECMNWVDQGQASLLALDAGEVYVAGRYHSLVPIMQELYSRSEPYQYSVAVIRKGGLPHVSTSTGLHALRGARACFSGVGALAGWVMPVHVLMQEGGLKITDCNNHVKSATEYFGESCAPNSLKDLYNPIGDNSDKLCRLCVGGAGVRCTLADPFAGYEGALRCLVANRSGDIAFVRDTTIQHALLSNKILGGVSPDQFELLCRDGSRAEVTAWERCHWGRVPADAVVTSSAYSSQHRARFQKFLQRLVQLYGEPNPYNNNSNRTEDWKDPFSRASSTTERSRFPYNYNRNYQDQREDNFVDPNGASTMAPYHQRTDQSGHPIELPFHLFRSNETTDLLLQDATINFMILKEEEQSAKFILNNKHVGDQAEKAVLGIRECPVKRAILCVTSDAEMQKCAKMRVALKAAFLSPRLSCWRAGSGRQCARAVAAGAADVTVLDAADMLHAAQHHRLVPFMQEIYTSGDNFYYAVAIAKEQDPDTDLTYLREKNTCHTGIGTAAGWVYPLAYLLSNGWIRPYGCDGAHAAAEYFSKSCAPGALSSEYVDTGSVPRDNLCHLCHGTSFDRCRRSASEPYYGALGAVRCAVEGGGHVAFARHSAPHEASAGRRREWWARDLLPSDLQLLCPDGTRAATHEYKHCNLGKVPGAVLVGRANHTELDALSDLLVYAQQLYGGVAHDDFSFSMFTSPSPYSDLIFSDAAVRLNPLPHNQRSAEIIAGPDLIRAARIVSCDAPQSAYYVASDPNFLSNAYRNGVVGTFVAFCLFIVALVR